MLKQSPRTKVEQDRARHTREQQRYRQRRKRGVKIARAPFDAETLNVLIDLGWLDPQNCNDPDAIGAAFFGAIKSYNNKR
jgi:hypothetical protein